MSKTEKRNQRIKKLAGDINYKMQPLNMRDALPLFEQMKDNKINTIKHYREMTGLGLKEAKDAVEQEMDKEKGYGEFLLNVALHVAMQRHRTSLSINMPGISVLVERFIAAHPKFSDDRVVDHFERIFKIKAAA